MNAKIINHSVKFIAIDEKNAGQRIDNFLFNILKGVPKGHVYKIIRKGEVRVNKGRIKQVYKLRLGDMVRIPPLKLAEKAPLAKPGRSLLALIEASIIYEDDYFIALNKPSGIAVHGGSGISYGIIEAIRALKPEHKFLELIHRLDRDTSGCLLIAKKRTSLLAIQDLFRQRQTDKRYIALLCGQINITAKKVTAPLLKQLQKSGDRIVRVDKQGKESCSYFSTLESFKQATLVEVKIVTGRTHQIRVHSQYLGHCVAGDTKYENYACNQRLKGVGLKRLFLHSAQISLIHPQSGKEITIKAPLTDELEQCLSRLRQAS